MYVSERPASTAVTMTAPFAPARPNPPTLALPTTLECDAHVVAVIRVPSRRAENVDLPCVAICMPTTVTDVAPVAA